ncbi:TIGR02466 family protein [Tumidithrix elongata RA019]|uniref:TIGR02466 family protein n=1 Tax=Tumidithrix elongata BACA0141 TaxID=2716417 RepID=A0AAW9Q5S8_9CYAN|nr:TIGR02466 family protein [Tumidithrix elongata RA019]
MVGNRSDWFPTAVWNFDLDTHEKLNQDLLSAIYAEKQRDAQGVNWSNSLGWHSVDNLHQKHPFKPLMDIVLTNATEVANCLAWDLSKYTVTVNNCWALVNGKFSSNFLHNHPNSLLSGAYYVQAAEECGGLFFRDPREVTHMTMPPLTELTPWTLQKVTYKPIPGRMIIFPSWLLHGVEPNLSEDERVTVSFNLGLRPIA